MKINENDLKPVIYVAGRYSDGGTLNEEERWKNRNILRYFSVKFMKKGWAVICPIENDEWAYEDGVITYEDTLSSDLAIIKKCDGIFFCPGWEKGKGTQIEHSFAQKYDIPIWYDVVPAKHEDRKSPFIVFDEAPISDLTTKKIKKLEAKTTKKKAK